MPKSSIAIRTPSCLDGGEPAAVCLDVAHQRGLGDLDRQRSRVEAAAESASATSPMNSIGVELACRRRSRPSRSDTGRLRQRGDLAQASSRTHLPTSTISPVSSSSGMKSSGWTIPRTGCFQRISASTPLGVMSLG